MFLYSYVLASVLLSFLALVFILVLIKNRKNGKKSFFDCLMIWPIMVEQHKEKATKYSNKFVFYGVVIMVVLVVFSILINP